MIISPLTLQTINIAPMMSIWGKGGFSLYSKLQASAVDCMPFACQVALWLFSLLQKLVRCTHRGHISRSEGSNSAFAPRCGHFSRPPSWMGMRHICPNTSHNASPSFKNSPKGKLSGINNWAYSYSPRETTQCQIRGAPRQSKFTRSQINGHITLIQYFLIRVFTVKIPLLCVIFLSFATNLQKLDRNFSRSNKYYSDPLLDPQKRPGAQRPLSTRPVE